MALIGRVVRSLGRAKPDENKSGTDFVVHESTDIGAHRFVPNMANNFGANFPEHIGKISKVISPGSGSKMAKAHVKAQGVNAAKMNVTK
jgi:hypothetical protein